MPNTVDAILRRIEALGYRIAMMVTARMLNLEAVHPGTGKRFIVHAGPNMQFAAARELADMMGVACEDILVSRRMPWPSDEPECDAISMF